MSRGRVLIVAGSDSGGGAGLQGDVKTVTVLGGHAATAVTAITVQNTLGVEAVHMLPPDLVAAQIRAVLTDIGADAIKIGMLGNAGVITAVADALDGTDAPIVLDPVMIAKGGARLLDDGAVGALMERLLPRATVVTPNAPELAALTGLPAGNEDEAQRAGHALAKLGTAVVVKGGHLPDDPELGMADRLIVAGEFEVTLRAPRVDTPHTHGTGCALASAIACGLAQGMGLAAAFRRAHAFVGAAIRAAPGLGGGHGPLGFLEGASALDD
ncbi:MAG: bifunctional hydroxymethylpyrimidine kinase/phosphomethylpyrimidine kinase [Sphingomonadaceae bacterium]|nr:bifunctional hydroxymethylpyrimidine kinase/phosphomethylpyrimidine kinase [Sphingomonadaceae bacterium]